MTIEENAVRDLLVRLRDLIAQDRPDFAYAIVLVDLDEPNFYAPLSYATNLTGEGLDAVGEFLKEMAHESGGDPPSDTPPDTPPDIPIPAGSSVQ